MGTTRLIVVEGNAPPVPRFAYVANMDDDTVSIYTVDAASGQLRANGYLGGYPYSLQRPSNIAVDPAGKFAFVGNNGIYSGNLTAITIDPGTGRITPVSNEATVPGYPTDQPSNIAVDPSGSFVYVTSYQAGTVSGFAINRTTGQLTATTRNPIGLQGPRAVAVHPNGKFAYLATEVGVYVAAIDVASGALAMGSPLPTPRGAIAIAIDPAGKTAIVSNADGTVSTFTIDSTTGALLAAVDGSPSGALVLGTVAISPSGPFAYVGSSNPNDIVGYLLNSTTGSLTPVPGGPFNAGFSPTSLVAEPSGKFLYALNSGNETIVTYAIDPANGKLTQLKSVRTHGQGAAIALSSGNTAVTYTAKYAYVANSSGNSVSAYSINPATAALTSVPGSPFAAGSGPTVAADPLGRFLYAADAGGGGGVWAFTVDPTTGSLAANLGSPFGVGSLALPSSITVDPSGMWVYVTNGAVYSDTVTGFFINGNQLRCCTPFHAGNAPSLVRLDQTGKFLYVTNALSNNLSVFMIDSSGNTTPVAGSPFAVGTDPLGLAIDPSGQFVYVANQVSNSVSAFQTNATSGALSEIAGSPYTTTGPLALAIDGTGSFLYVANHSATNNISAYSINAVTGALTLLPTSPFTAGNAPNDISVDFSGKFLYVANGGSNDVSVFSINAVNGTLTQVVGSPFAAGSVPGSVVTLGQIR
jgi:6-phosphogluconolactonase (cycloisomerase 2 family)